MEAKRKIEGLCENCKFASECSYIKNSTKPTIFCEEFECQGVEGEVIPLTSGFNESTNVASLKPISDICETCDEKGGCEHKARAYGPILFCEDYN